MARRRKHRSLHVLAAVFFLIATGFAATPARANFGVEPIVDCVSFNEFTNQIIVYWGYDNTNTFEVTVDNSFNFFVPGPGNRDQPVSFPPGIHHFAFTTASDAGSSVTWVLGEFFATAQNDPTTYCYKNAQAAGTPIAQNLNLATNRNTPLPVTLVGSDTAGGAVTYSLSTNPAHGTLSGSGASYTYTPALNYTGSDSFQYQVLNAALTSASATVNITVSPVNLAPVAFPDGYSTAEETTLNVPAPGVLANDSDADGDPITVAGVGTPPAHGTLSLNSNGSFSYTPAPLFHGTDSFTYTDSDGIVSSPPATVTIDVSFVNHPPVATSSTVSTPQISAVAIPLIASDVDGQTLAYSIVSPPAHGTLSGTPPAVTYTPVPTYAGADAFTFKVNDGIVDSNVATVAITVSTANRVPVAMPDGYSTAEGQALNVAAPGVLANDSDTDGDAITVGGVVTPPAHGTLALNANGSFTYTPASLFHGTDSFAYTATDGIAPSAPATVTINVTPVNQVPTVTNSSISTPEQPVPITLSATDPDGDPLTYSVTQAPQHGQLSGSGAALTYTPTQFYKGSDSFSWVASDGTAQSAVAQVSITVTPVNHPPVAQNDSYTVGASRQITVAAPGVLGNDSDPDQDPLTATLVAPPQSGTLTLHADGSFNFIAADTTPVSFVYAACDPSNACSHATVSLLSTRQSATATVTGGATICSGGSATITVNLTGASPWTIVWNDGVSTSTASSIVQRSVSPSVTTTYALQSVRDAFGAGSAFGSAEIEVNKIPAPPAISGPPSFLAGSTLRLMATLGFDSYQWSRNGVAIPGANGQEYDIFDATAGDAATYSVTGFLGACASASSAAFTTQLEQPLQLILPVVGTVKGSFGSSFRTRVQMYNDTSDAMHGSLVFHPEGTSASPQDPSLPLLIPPQQTVTLDDVGLALGVDGLGSADIFIDEGTVPEVVVEVLNDNGSLGTTGMSYAALGTDQLLSSGTTARLIAPSDPSQNRFNLGVRTIEASTVRFTVRGSDGQVMKTVEEQFPAEWFEQKSAADFLGVPLSGSETIQIDILQGSLVIYGSTTNDLSNDSAIQFAQ